MSDTEYEGPELKPLPHPELFNLEVEPEPAATPPPTPEATNPPAPQAAPSAQPKTAPATAPQASSAQPLWKRVVLALSTLVLHALLINAAAEAVLKGAPLQWWIVGTVGGVLVLTALLWRPTGWAMKAGLATLALLGLLAGTLWYVGDVSQGLTLIGQPSALVLTAVSGLLVGGAGLWLMLHRAVPWWGKVIVGLITVYGTAAFVLPLLKAAGVPDVLAMANLDRLPFWLQGQFIGVVVILPLALLALLITGVTQVRGRQLWGWGFRMAAFSMGLFIAFQLSADALPTLVAPGASQPAAEPAPVQPEAEPAAPLQPDLESVPPTSSPETQPETPASPEPAPPTPTDRDI